jgi:uncharacterized LabA/DUF88 family protein
MNNEAQLQSARLAVLIDADNASANLIEPLLKEVTKYGIAHVKRIYGDWTNPRLNKWKDILNKFAIHPIQQFGYTTGKNSTDSALIIDAMDLLYTKNFDGFCIVSSDSDFTGLARRIRESGLTIYGFGEEKTPEAFVRACDKFIYTEILRQQEALTGISSDSDQKRENKAESKAAVPQSIAATGGKKLRADQQLSTLLSDAYDAVADEDGWANLGTFGAQLTKLSSSFDSRIYGYKKLGDLIRATELFDIRETPHDKSPAVKELHIKWKSGVPVK